MRHNVAWCCSKRCCGKDKKYFMRNETTVPNLKMWFHQVFQTEKIIITCNEFICRNTCIFTNADDLEFCTSTWFCSINFQRNRKYVYLSTFRTAPKCGRMFPLVHAETVLGKMSEVEVERCGSNFPFNFELQAGWHSIQMNFDARNNARPWKSTRFVTLALFLKQQPWCIWQTDMDVNWCNYWLLHENQGGLVQGLAKQCSRPCSTTPYKATIQYRKATGFTVFPF